MELRPLKILLIAPPFYRLYKDAHPHNRYPLALGYLSGMVKKNTQWNVMAYNADFYPKTGPLDLRYMKGIGYQNYLDTLKDESRPIWGEITSTIKEYNPSVIGISANSQNFASARIVARLIKKINKDIIVVFGGPHPSMVEAEILTCDDIDICVRGEGEITLIELLNAIGNQRGLSDIKGISYRDNGRIIENTRRELINDLDSLPFPNETAAQVLKDFHLYPLDALRNIFAIRGCPYDCYFCGSREIWTRKVRFRSPENVITEINGLRQMGIHNIRFDDDTFGVNKKYIHDLCTALIKNCPGLRWECEMHVRLVDEKTISLMKQAGCVKMQIGIESGNNEILSLMRKNYTIEEALSACDTIKRNGIILQAFFMVGFPQETERTLNDTLSAMHKTNCDHLVYSIFTPYPGTEMFDFCEKHGLIKDDFDISLYNHKSPANCFCMYLTHEQMRKALFDIERIVEKKDRIHRMFHKVRRVKELGLMHCVRKRMERLEII